MLEATIVAVRLLQYLGAMVLFGSSLFFAYAAPDTWPRRLLASAAALLALSSLLAIGAQASLFAGSLTAGFTGEALGAVVSSMALGKAALVRAVAASLAFSLLVAPDTRLTRPAVIALAAIATSSLAWMGHAAASESGIHLLGDAVHALAAAIWLGALAAFLLLLAAAKVPADLQRLHVALRRFSAVGIPVVIVLALSGILNGWYLVGPDNLTRLPFSPYGRLLLAKLAAFGAMVVLAAINRIRLTPALDAQPDQASVAQLRRSIGLEAALGFAVLGLVAGLGMLQPPSAI